jgi:hypothetical protein
MVSTLSYASVHAAVVLVATIALARALGDTPRPTAWALAAGALWGIATLVRPTSLILPPFVLLAAWWTRGRRRGLRTAALVTLAMAVVIAPYTLRNLRVSGRFIPVNAQDGFALWGLATTAAPRGGGLEWVLLWRREGTPLFLAVTGERYSTRALYAHTVAMNDAFRADAVRRIRDAPGRFLRKAATTLFLFVTDSCSSWMEGAPASRRFTVAVLLVGAFGLARGLWQGRTGARAILAVAATFAAAHALSLLLPRYTYVRFPLVLLAAPLAFGRRAAIPVGLVAVAAVLSAAEIARHDPLRGLAATLAQGRDCGDRCPDAPLTRAEMAELLVAAREGPAYVPPPCVVPEFADVACDDPRAPWIAEAVARGIAGGCDGGRFCPAAPVNRAEMAGAVLRAREGAGYAPPPCGAPVFSDVPCADPHAAWVNELAVRNVTEGCGAGNFCPLAPVTRRQAGVFVAATFATPPQ